MEIEGRSRKDLERGIAISAVPLQVATVDGQVLVDLPADLVARYRMLYTRMAREATLPHRIGLLAALRGEGVTTVALGLSAVLANDLEARVCLVEANFWWPGLAAIERGEHSPGLAEVALGRRKLDEALRPTGLETLWLLPAGLAAPEERARLARSRALANALQSLGERFDYLVLDIPAILACGDSLPLAEHADALYLVIRQAVTPLALIRQALDEIEHLPLRGVVLSAVHCHLPNWIQKWVGNNS